MPFKGTLWSFCGNLYLHLVFFIKTHFMHPHSLTNVRNVFPFSQNICNLCISKYAFLPQCLLARSPCIVLWHCYVSWCIKSTNCLFEEWHETTGGNLQRRLRPEIRINNKRSGQKLHKVPLAATVMAPSLWAQTTFCKITKHFSLFFAETI